MSAKLQILRVLMQIQDGDSLEEIREDLLNRSREISKHPDPHCFYCEHWAALNAPKETHKSCINHHSLMYRRAIHSSDARRWGCCCYQISDKWATKLKIVKAE